MSEERMPNRRRLRGCRAPIIAIATAASLAALAADESSPAGNGRRTIIAESRFDVTNPAQQVQLVQLVVDFPSGAWTSWHTHGGQAINLVLEGEMTLRHAGMDQGYRAGQAWTDSSTQVHAAGNSGAGKARLLTNFVLPQGAPDTVAVQESSFEPTIAYAARFSLPALPANAQIVQQVVELGPASQAQGTLAGFAATVVLAGEVAYKIGSELKVYKSGDAWSAPAGTIVADENKSASSARVFTSYLLPAGTVP
jgi:quercetin dioxygenase-like cupin family protein